MHRSKLECSAAAWGPFKEFGLVANRSQPELETDIKNSTATLIAESSNHQLIARKLSKRSLPNGRPNIIMCLSLQGSKDATLAANRRWPRKPKEKSTCAICLSHFSSQPHW